MKIALFPNPSKKQSNGIANEIVVFLKKRGATVFVEDDRMDIEGAQPLSSTQVSQIDFAISLGGDGTILRLIHNHPELQAPVLGINMGSLGFMADVPIPEIYPSLQALFDKKYRIQRRLMMDGKTSTGKTCYAVNDIVIHRAENPCLIELSVYVDDIYLNTFAADGIIISTPSGSTAYSLAAGGPILTPELQSFVITPICPHTISNRPIVLMPTKEIRIEYMSEHQPVEVTYDGFCTFSIAKNEDIRITPSQRQFKLVSMLNHDYFSTLRTKLGWAGKLRY